MYIKKNKIGIISGFIFGLFSVVYGTMGLASNVAATIGILLASPGIFPIRLITSTGNISASISSVLMISAFLINGVFYAFIGSLIQNFLRKKGTSEWLVIYIFIIVIAVLILSIIVEYIIRGGLTA